MRTTLTPNRVIAVWLKEVKRNGWEFAWVKTTEAEYDRAVVVSESDNNLTVEFPKSTGNREKPWKIVRNIIPKRQLLSVRYYKEE